MWADAVGPEEPKSAKSAAPFSLRANYGTSRVANAVHASASRASAQSEVASLFPSLKPLLAATLANDSEGGREKDRCKTDMKKTADYGGMKYQSRSMGITLSCRKTCVTVSFRRTAICYILSFERTIAS